ncbi:MAG: tetratricopeptide repeat protein [Spirochaetes bacterium]|nr:tetratricopeptide repeat protein [Spirochaetota bacterium]
MSRIFIYILSAILFLFFNCSSKKATFLYRGEFFKKGISPVNHPYQLTTDVSSEFYPAVSADGKYIVYVSDKTGNLDLWLYSVLDRSSYQITYHTSDDTMPAFSKNGKEVVFVSFRMDSQGDIYKIDFSDILDRSRTGLSEQFKKELLKDDLAKQITKNRIQESEPAYIDNKYIYFVRKDARSIKNIFKTKDSPGADIVQVTLAGAISPDFSSDKNLMACIDISKYDNRKGHIIIYNLRSGVLEQITFGNSIEARPKFINNNLLLYSSIRLDSNKNGKIDLNDNSSLYIYDLNTKQERQLTSEDYTDYYPIYAPLYNGVIMYTSNLANNIDLWMLPLEGIIPKLDDPHKQMEMVEALDNNYHKLIGYINLLNEDMNKNMIRIKIARMYNSINYRDRSMTYLSNARADSEPDTEDHIRATIDLIENSYQKKEQVIDKLLILKNSIKKDKKEAELIDLINYKLYEIYKNSKEYEKAILALEEIVSGYKGQDEFLYECLDNLMELYLRLNKSTRIKKYISVFNALENFNRKIDFQNKYILLYIKYSPSLNKDEEYKKLLSRFGDDDNFRYSILYHWAVYTTNKKRAQEMLINIIKEAPASYFKIKAFYQIYSYTKDENLLYQIINQPESGHPEAENIVQQAKNILINKFLEDAKLNYNHDYYLNARTFYGQALYFEEENIGALTGQLRCDLKLLKKDEDKYSRLIEKYDKLLKDDPLNYVYHYLKGYGYSLIYADYYHRYKLAEREGEPFIFRKIVDLFRKNDPYPSTLKNKMEKYFKLSEESLKITYRIKPDFIPAYLTAGWLYQVQSEIDRDNFMSYIENAVPLYQSAIHFNDEQKDTFQEASLCLNLANVYINLKNYSQAIYFYDKKLKYSRKFDNPMQEAYFYYHFGYAGWFLGKNMITLENFQKSYKLFLAQKEYHGAYRSAVFLAMVYRIEKEYEKSLKYYNIASEMIDQYKLDINKARLFREIGICYQKLQDPLKALHYFNKAEKIIPKDKKVALWNRPSYRIGLEDFTIPVWFTELTLAQSISYYGFRNRDEQKLLYSLISETYDNFLDYKKSIEYLLLKKELFEEDHNYDAIPYVYNNLGILYFKLNDHNTAKNYFSQAIELLEKNTEKDKEGNKVARDPKGIVINNINLTEVLIKQNEGQPITKYFTEVWTILDKTIKTATKKKFSAELIKAYDLSGLIFFKRAMNIKKNRIDPDNMVESIRDHYADFLSSLKYYKLAYSTASIKNRKKDMLKISFNIGLIYYFTGDLNTAEQAFTELHRDSNKYFMRELKWKTEYYLFKIKQLQDKSISLDMSHPDIIDQIESVPKGYDYSPKQDDIIEAVYDEYIDDLLQRTNYWKALQVMEKKKNFTIKETFRSYPFELRQTDKSNTTRLKEKENEILKKTDMAQKELMIKFNSSRRTEYEIALEKLFSEREEIGREINNSNPQLLYYTYKNDTDLKEMMKDISDENAILVFHLYETNLYIGSVTNSQITFIKTHISPEKFREAIAQLTVRLKEEDPYADLSNYFDHIIIDNIRDVIENKKLITIIPDGKLFAFPFHLFLKDKKVHYDISLRQFFYNLEKTPVAYNSMTIFNSGSDLNDIPCQKTKFPEKEVKKNILDKLFSKSSILHITDGIIFDSYNPINYKLIYNKKYDIPVNDLLKTSFAGELFSFEKTAPELIINEKNIYALVLPLYYTGIGSITFNLWEVKEKINQNFWEAFYKQTDEKLIDRYLNSIQQLTLSEKKDHDSSFKVLYGNFGIDKNYKVNILIKKTRELLNMADAVKESGQKINYYEKALEFNRELISLKTNAIDNSKNVTEDLISLHVKESNYSKAMVFLEQLISDETDTSEKERLQKEYDEIFRTSQLTNNDIDKFKKYIAEGDTSYDLKNFKQAAISYKNAVAYLENSTLNEERTPVVYKLCRALFSYKDLDEAGTWIEKGYTKATNENNSNDIDTFSLLYARLYFLKDDIDTAMIHLNRIRNEDNKYIILKIYLLLNSDLDKEAKDSQINNLINKNRNKFSRTVFKNILDPVINHYQDDITNAYQYINMVKRSQTSFDKRSIQDKLNKGSVLIDLYSTENFVYSVLISKTGIKGKTIKKNIFTSRFNDYISSIKKNDEDDFIEARDSLLELLFDSFKVEINRSSEIIISPYDVLYQINYYNNGNNILSFSNQNIKIIRSYDSLSEQTEKKYSFSGFGIRKNLPGKIIIDFSFKEIKSLQRYFKGSVGTINPSSITLDKNANALHLAMQVDLNRTNVMIIDENNRKKYDLQDILHNKKMDLMLLTKIQYQDIDDKILQLINSDKLILSLWRKNDALSAIFVRKFYSFLSRSGSVNRSFQNAWLEMKKNYKNELGWNSFILIQ